MTDWPALTAAPGATIRRTRSPCSMFSPNSGSLNSITACIFLVDQFVVSAPQRLKARSSKLLRIRTDLLMCNASARTKLSADANLALTLADCRVCFFRIDYRVADRALYHVIIDLVLTRQGAEGRDHNVLGVDFEEVAEGR